MIAFPFVRCNQRNPAHCSVEFQKQHIECFYKYNSVSSGVLDRLLLPQLQMEYRQLISTSIASILQTCNAAAQQQWYR